MNRDNIWAPWRMAYLRDLERKRQQLGAPETVPNNFLHHYWIHPVDDEANLVVERDEHGMILLNRYPYANGHLLVALGDARPRLLDYEPAQRAAFWRLVDRAMELIHATLCPQGINVGVNEGLAAGAGVPEHLHAHLVPRWAGDTNFITVTGNVRVIPGALEEMAAAYRDARQALSTRDTTR